MNKRIRYLGASLLVAVLGAFLAGGCGSESTSDSIKIGANVEMTGTNATFGTSAINGMDMAIEEINNSGGVFHRKLELIKADNRSETAEAVSAMQKLLDNNVAAVIGPMTSSSVIAAAQIVTDAKILDITPTASNPNVTVDPRTGQVRKYVFRTTFIDPFQGRLMADYAVRDLHGKRAAILVDNSSEYSKGLANYFIYRFQALGGTVVGQEAYLQRDTEFRSILTKIKNDEPDIIFIPGYYQEVGMIIKQARDMDMKMPILGGDGWDSARLAQIAGAGNLQDTYFSTHYSPEDSTQSIQDFIKKYKAKYGEVPDSFALLSYDSVYMLKAAIEKANIVDPEKIAEAMGQLKSFQGASGDIRIDSDHNAIAPGVIMTFDSSGAPVFKAHINP